MAPMRLMRAAIPEMAGRGWGRIVNVASSSGKRPGHATSPTRRPRRRSCRCRAPSRTPTPASGVLVNAVTPGPWPASCGWSPAASSTRPSRPVAARAGGAGRDCRPRCRSGVCRTEEIAAVIVFLCSEQASTSSARPGRSTAARCRSSSEFADSRRHARQHRRDRQDLPRRRLRGRPREDPRVRAGGGGDTTRSTSTRRPRAAPASPMWSRRRCSPWSTQRRGHTGPVRPRRGDRLRPYGARRPGVPLGSAGRRRRRDHHHRHRQGRVDRGGMGFYVFETVAATSAARPSRRHLDQHRQGWVTR